MRIDITGLIELYVNAALDEVAAMDLEGAGYSTGMMSGMRMALGCFDKELAKTVKRITKRVSKKYRRALRNEFIDKFVRTDRARFLRRFNWSVYAYEFEHYENFCKTLLTELTTVLVPYFKDEVDFDYDVYLYSLPATYIQEQIASDIVQFNGNTGKLNGLIRLMDYIEGVSIYTGDWVEILSKIRYEYEFDISVDSDRSPARAMFCNVAYMKLYKELRSLLVLEGLRKGEDVL